MRVSILGGGGFRVPLIARQLVADGLPVLGVEVPLARSREMALTEEDIYVRRTRLSTLGSL